MSEDQAAIERFDGVARLFPLPNLVLFPSVDQGLHIFEHRYRQMTADALAGDQLIAMVLLTPNENWDETYDGRPPIEPTACLGRITVAEALPDGRFNLQLRGLGRLRLAEETPADDKLYRLARGELLADVRPPIDEATRLRRELRGAVLAHFDPSGPAHQHLNLLFESDTPLGEVCDLLSYSLPLSLPLKQHLLSEPHVDSRARALIAAVGTALHRRPFPPGFSSN